MNEDLRAAAAAATAIGPGWYETEEDFDAGPWYPEDKALALLASPDRILALLDENEKLREALDFAAHLLDQWLMGNPDFEEGLVRQTITRARAALGAPEPKETK